MTPFDIRYVDAAKAPYHILLPRGMLAVVEHKLLYLLGKSCFSGRGHVVDAGSFIGSSAYCLCAGMAASAAADRTHRRLHAYDLFVADEPYVVEAVQAMCFQDFTGGPGASRITVKQGFDFEEIFWAQNGRYESMISLNKGDFGSFRWRRDHEIEILFVDIAKTQALNSHVFSEFFPSLVPERGILIQQDFHHAHHTYIHASMEYLRHYFEIFVSSAGATRAYRLKERVPASLLDRVIAYDFSVGERVDLLRRMVELAPRFEKTLLAVIVAKELYEAGDLAGFEAQVRQLPVLAHHPTTLTYCLAQVRAFAGDRTPDLEPAKS